MSVKRIDADTIVITDEKIIKISDLKAKKAELEIMNPKAKEIHETYESLSEEMKPFFVDVPIHDKEIEEFENLISYYESLDVEKDK